MDHRKTVWKGVDWIQVAQNRNKWSNIVNTIVKLRIALYGKILNS
jgi:hypothetical protein